MSAPPSREKQLTLNISKNESNLHLCTFSELNWFRYDTQSEVCVNKITPRNQVYTASWGSYIFKLCHIGVTGLDGRNRLNIPISRCCRKFLIGAVVWAETVVVRGNGRISTQNRKYRNKQFPIISVFDAKPKNTRNDSSYQSKKSALTNDKMTIFVKKKRKYNDTLE